MPSTTKLQSCLPLLCPKSPPNPYSPACTTVASSCKVCKSALHHSGFDCHPFFGTKNSSSAAPHTVIISRGKVVSKSPNVWRQSETSQLSHLPGIIPSLPTRNFPFCPLQFQGPESFADDAPIFFFHRWM